MKDNIDTTTEQKIIRLLQQHYDATGNQITGISVDWFNIKKIGMQESKIKLIGIISDGIFLLKT